MKVKFEGREQMSTIYAQTQRSPFNRVSPKIGHMFELLKKQGDYSELK